MNTVQDSCTYKPRIDPIAKFRIMKEVMKNIEQDIPHIDCCVVCFVFI